MSTILLVRHGQARFGARDYDHLSDLGVRQSEILGRALMARGIRPACVLSGGMKRHAMTVEAACRAAGWDVEPSVEPAWDEYDHQDIIAAFKPAYRRQVVMKADLVRSLHPRQNFASMFEKALTRWVDGEHDEDYRESFPAFTDRVDAGLAALSGRLEEGQTALVVTSGGPIAWAATSLLGGSAFTWDRLNSTCANTALTRITAGERGLSLISFGEQAHLEAAVDPTLVTYR
ncbi:histidine phosphatase family protein [Actinomycetota bacterium]